jgi:hypothetical protein
MMAAVIYLIIQLNLITVGLEMGVFVIKYKQDIVLMV